MSTRTNALLLLVCTISEKQFSYGFRPITSSRDSIKFGRQGRSISLASSSASEYYSILRDKLETPPESIIRAVERIGPNVPISVGDASALSGTDLNTARVNLMTLATLTGGDLEVTENGEIMYSFPRGVRSVLERRSLGQKIKVTYNKASPFLYYGLRASFGTLLLTSLVIIVFTVVAASVSASSSSSSSDSRDDRRSNSYGREMTNFDFNFDLNFFYSRQYTRYYQSPGFQPDYSKSEQSDKKVSFIEGFFSYVFGDGDPNSGIRTEETSLHPHIVM